MDKIDKTLKSECNTQDQVPWLNPISLKGAGAFGYVLEAYDNNIQQKVAIKRTHKVGQLMSREHQILAELKNHENIVNLYTTFYTTDNKGDVIQNCMFEYVKGSLENFLKPKKEKNEFLPIKTIKVITLH